uniref:Uncharacterized protein n=1 Tax=Panagrellus redivivus TaxID=6233 RepID=A0A7E4VVN7_PANRE
MEAKPINDHYERAWVYTHPFIFGRIMPLIKFLAETGPFFSFVVYFTCTVKLTHVGYVPGVVYSIPSALFLCISFVTLYQRSYGVAEFLLNVFAIPTLMLVPLFEEVIARHYNIYLMRKPQWVLLLYGIVSYFILVSALALSFKSTLRKILKEDPDQANAIVAVVEIQHDCCAVFFCFYMVVLNILVYSDRDLLQNNFGFNANIIRGMNIGFGGMCLAYMIFCVHRLIHRKLYTPCEPSYVRFEEKEISTA